MAARPADNDSVAPQSQRISRALGVVLIVALGVHVLLVAAKLPAPKYDFVEPGGAMVVSFLAFGGLFITRRRAARAMAVLGTVLVASALLTPGVVFLVALIMLNSYIVGDWLLGRAAAPATPSASESTSIPLLVGCTVWLGAMSLTASLKVHYAPVYVFALLLPPLVLWEKARIAVRTLWHALARPETAPSENEIAWLTLLCVIVVMHLFVVAKPDVGHDANAMHLQFARLLADRHQWKFDVLRHAWAVMPLGADFGYAAAFFLGGEYAARLLNFAFGLLACRVVYELVTKYAHRETALASVCLVASMPLAFLETGTLFVDNLWTAFLLAALLAAVNYARTQSSSDLAACALLAAGAMQTKAVAIVWIAPLILALFFVMARNAGQRAIGRSAWTLIGLALLLAAWPYANAWIRTGSPVFPFMNAIFRSPLFDTTASLVNPRYQTTLEPSSLYDIFLSSGRFIEGEDGAAGFQWLLLLPIFALGFAFRRRSIAQWLCAGLAGLFFVGVFSQQAYLRYLLPFLMLFAVLAAWALDDFVRGPRTRVTLIASVALLCVLNLRFMYAASWPNQQLCLRCGIDDQTRSEYIATFLPDRTIADYLNVALPSARVGFFLISMPGESGYLGYSRAANWHDVELFTPLLKAKTPEDVLELTRRFRLTHVVLWRREWDLDPPVMGAFRDRYTIPVFSFGSRVVAAIDPQAR
jgi:4-amino-4-deoxy-L-arabinose transferase-like glycosyltransferase